MHHIVCMSTIRWQAENKGKVLMDPAILKTIGELGIAVVALVLFYKMNEDSRKEHRQERIQDSTLWRDELSKRDEVEKERANKQNRVLEELTKSIKEVRVEVARK